MVKGDNTKSFSIATSRHQPSSTSDTQSDTAQEQDIERLHVTAIVSDIDEALERLSQWSTGAYAARRCSSVPRSWKCHETIMITGSVSTEKHEQRRALQL